MISVRSRDFPAIAGRRIVGLGHSLPRAAPKTIHPFRSRLARSDLQQYFRRLIAVFTIRTDRLPATKP
ncbi:MAG: hypothetical protein WBA02_16445 [Jannaschia helgolandensis]|uniref:hypothetical protein n=1 Tax=Jannaschia helgolandensis TaxID=188906 RepID=UPI003C73C4A0